ncbi:hypothetical protein K3495_g4431 [Podosphaera aphanis]|nr:hypothetical protein K3495_g4431 [Podosphaera aphanis]
MITRSSLLSAFRRSARPTSTRLPLLPTISLRWLSDETRSAIEEAISSAPVVLFMKGTPDVPQCGFSRVSVQILGLQGVDPAKFKAFNVLGDERLRSGIKEYSEWPTIPQLYVDKEFIGGSDILVSMHQNGDLAKLLEEKSALAFGPEEEEKTSGTASVDDSTK